MDCMGQEKDAYNYRKRLIKTINSIKLFWREYSRDNSKCMFVKSQTHTYKLFSNIR